MECNILMLLERYSIQKHSERNMIPMYLFHKIINSFNTKAKWFIQVERTDYELKCKIYI